MGLGAGGDVWGLGNGVEKGKGNKKIRRGAWGKGKGVEKEETNVGFE